MPNPSLIFDRQRVKRHRDRAARTMGAHDFLLREMAERLAERLEDIKRNFPAALDLGAHHSILRETLHGRGGIEWLVETDLSQRLFASQSTKHEAQSTFAVADEELLPFADNSFDLILSCGSLHTVNDLPGALIQIQRALKPDGLFLAMLPGGGTLAELRQSFEQAELQHKGGISPRVAPFVDVRDAGALLQRAGFALPVADSEMLTVEYEHPLKLLADLRGMGETSALTAGVKHFTSRKLMTAAMEYYTAHFSHAGRVRASVELVTITGWKPHASQQQPAKRGSGKVNLGDVL